MLKSFLMNTRKPEGRGGALALSVMNVAHSSMAKWGLSQLPVKSDATILDVGCGGGKNIARMLEMAPQGKVYGLDYSIVSVDASRKLNSEAIEANRSQILQGSVSNIPYSDGMFDVVTAFETVYFWPDFLNDLKEVERVLKLGGTVFICNEVTNVDNKEGTLSGLMKMIDAKSYSPDDFINILGRAGFIDVQINMAKNKWLICVLARKS